MAVLKYNSGTTFRIPNLLNWRTCRDTTSALSKELSFGRYQYNRLHMHIYVHTHMYLYTSTYPYMYMYLLRHMHICIYSRIFVYKPDMFPRNSSLRKFESLMQNSAAILLCDIPKCIMNTFSHIKGALQCVFFTSDLINHLWQSFACRKNAKMIHHSKG